MLIPRRIKGKRRPGFSLIEVMIAALILAFTATIFAAVVPQSMRMRSKSENVTRASLLAQQKIEQLRALAYDDINYDALRVASIVDASPSSTPFSFTQVDGLTTKLPEGSGTLSISDVATDLKRVDVTVSWGGGVSTVGSSVTMSTLITNRANVEASSS